MRKIIFFTIILGLAILNYNLYAQAKRGLEIRIRTPQGEELTPFENSYALIIGINKYENWNELSYAVNDAKGIRKLLVENFGYDPSKIYQLYDKDATKKQILRVFDTLIRKTMKNDRVIIFFAGHGSTSQIGAREKGYIIPVDADGIANETTAISTTQIRDIALDMRAKHLYLVMDACYSGMIFQRGGTPGFERGRFLKEITSRKSRDAITAGQKDQTVADGGPEGHSYFTWYFINGLKTGDADLNHDGVVTAREIGNYVAPKVSNISEQTPRIGDLEGDEGGEFVFVLKNCVPQSSSSAKRLEPWVPEIGRGTAIFRLDQTDVYLYIDGNPSGLQIRNEIKLSLPIGGHRIKFSKDGYSDFEQDVGITKYEEPTFTVSLTRIARETKKARISYGGMAVTSEPKGATIIINNVEQPQTTDFTVDNLSPGKYAVTVEKRYYHPYVEEIEISPGAFTTIHAKLKPDFGYLKISTNLSEADIFLNGKFQGKGVVEFPQIESGRYEIEAKANPYHSYSETITVIDGGRVEKMINLKPAFGRLQILSKPLEANINIDGKPYQNPVDIARMPSGTYNIRVTSTLYHPAEKIVSIEDGSFVHEEIDLKPAFGKLILKSNPSGAEVLQGGVKKGKTTLALDRLPSGEYYFTLKMDKYKPKDISVIIRDGKTEKKTVDLAADFGLLNLTSNVYGSKVYLNGKFKGNTPIEKMKVKPGSYSVKIVDSENKYLEYANSFSIAVGGEKSINAPLIRKTGTLKVVTNPPAARILLDGAYRGKSPTFIADLPTGECEVKVEKKDYLMQTRMVIIPYNDVTELKLNLNTYIGSMQQRAEGWGRQKRLGFLGSIALGAAAGYFKKTADKAFDSYRQASSIDEAVHQREKTENNNLYAQIAAGTSGVIFSYALFSWIKQGYYASKAESYSIGIWKNQESIGFALLVKLP